MIFFWISLLEYDSFLRKIEDPEFKYRQVGGEGTIMRDGFLNSKYRIQKLEKRGEKETTDKTFLFTLIAKQSL